jgi:transposase-like protein
MTRKADRELAAGFKAQVALAALRGHASLEELAIQFNLDPNQIAEWKEELERNAEAAFLRPDVPSGEAPTLPTAPPLAKSPTLPTLPATPGQPAVPLPPTRLKATTLPTLPTFEEQPTLPQWPSGPKSPTQPTRAVSGSTLNDDYWEDETLQTTRVNTGKGVAIGATPPPVDDPVPAWTRKLFGPLFVGWQEKHHAAKTSRELLKIYRTVAAAHPGLDKRQLYRQIVMVRLGGTLAAAEAVLVRAAESFSTWPAERPLTFRDVVHYLAVSDYLASNNDVADWARENLGRVVASYVPDNL